MSALDVEVFLEHYGVKGMKWGVRNEEKRSARQKAKKEKNEIKAKKFDAKAEEFRKAIQDVDSKLSDARGYRKSSLEEQRKALFEQQTNAELSAKAKREGKLTPGQKKALKGAALATALVVAYGTYTMAQSGELNRKVTQGKLFLEKRHGTPWKFNPNLARKDLDADGILNDVVKHVNPEYGGLGTKMNCRRCTFAYEMRRRGYDVSATKTTNAWGQTGGGVLNAISPGKDKFEPSHGFRLLSKASKDPSFMGSVSELGLGKQRMSNPADIFKTIRSNPDGARGELTVLWKQGGGHSMAWEIIGGKPVIFDAQSGKRFSSIQEFASVNKIAYIQDAGITRLDNLPLNHDFLMRWLKSA